MALTTVTLKPNVFLTLEDVQDWLGMSPDACKDVSTQNRLTRLLNSATDMAEKYLGGPIKIRQFKGEIRDGDSSNEIIPDHYPIRSVEQIKVDFNRAFGPETIIDASNYILRGNQDLNGVMQGTDIVLRDDDNTAIFGRIFSGSVLGSISIDYTAGWGNTQDDMPADLVQAILMTVEYYSRLRDSKDINTKSKAVNGQSITRTIGMPQEVKDILDSYKDYTLGRANQPQKNVFTL